MTETIHSNDHAGGPAPATETVVRINRDDEADHRLMECHHRIKNHLQLVSSLIALQISKCSDPSSRLVLATAHNQVLAIARLQLWPELDDKLQIVNVAAFLSQFCGDLEQALGLDTQADHLPHLATSIAPCEASAQAALTLALITNELVTNAVKYAGAKTIMIDWRADDDDWRLTVADDGRGLSPAFLELSTGLGALLLQKMSATLRGVVEVGTPARGASVAVRIPRFALAPSQPHASTGT